MLMIVLGNPALHAGLKHYLDTVSFSGENIDFLDAEFEYRSNFPSVPKTSKRRWRAICTKYIVEGAPDIINIASTMIAPIQASCGNAQFQPTATIFKAAGAVGEVRQLIIRDTLPRWLKTKEAAALMATYSLGLQKFYKDLIAENKQNEELFKCLIASGASKGQSAGESLASVFSLTPSCRCQKKEKLEWRMNGEIESHQRFWRTA
jgi:hypothetical protein